MRGDVTTNSPPLPIRLQQLPCSETFVTLSTPLLVGHISVTWVSEGSENLFKCEMQLFTLEPNEKHMKPNSPQTQQSRVVGSRMLQPEGVSCEHSIE